MNILLKLYIVFFKIGLFAFGGGYAVLPLIQKYVVNDYKWLNINQLTDLISLSQMTPGPIGINSATFIGTKMGGIFGAIIATFGNITPQLIIMMILGHILFNGKRFKALDYILKGLKPTIVGLIAIATVTLLQSSIFIISKNKFSIDCLGLLGFIIAIYFYKIKNISFIKVVGISALVGVLIQFIRVYIF